MSIDSLIWEDGALIAPDTVQLMEILNRESRTEKGILESLLDLRGNNLHNQLLSSSQMKASDPFMGRSLHRARFLLRLFENHGELAMIAAFGELLSKERFVSSDVIVRELRDCSDKVDG